MEWKTSKSPIDYPEALQFMEQRVAAIIDRREQEMVWLLEHPPLYTAGTSATPSDLKDKMGFPVYPTGRGGQWTYHCPGQRIAYVMLDLKRRAYPQSPDIRKYVFSLENWIIATLKELGIEAYTVDGKIGVWTLDHKKHDAKIAAIGIRVRKWVTYHGISLNVSPDLSHYGGIIPCGISQQGYGVTSLKALGVDATLQKVDEVLKQKFSEEF